MADTTVARSDSDVFELHVHVVFGCGALVCQTLVHLVEGKEGQAQVQVKVYLQ